MNIQSRLVSSFIVGNIYNYNANGTIKETIFLVMTVPGARLVGAGMIAGGIGSLSYGLSETSDSLFGVNPLKSFIVDTLGFSEDTYHLFGLVSGMASMAGMEAYEPFANSGTPTKAPQKSNNNNNSKPNPNAKPNPIPRIEREPLERPLAGDNMGNLLKGLPDKGVSKAQNKLITGEDWNSYFKETYGEKNVRWESAVNSMDDIIDTPSLITRLNPNQLSDLANKSSKLSTDINWNYGPLKLGRNKGIQYEKGGGISINKNVNGNVVGDYIQYHPGSGYHGEIPYYKVSSAPNGEVKFYYDNGTWNYERITPRQPRKIR